MNFPDSLNDLGASQEHVCRAAATGPDKIRAGEE
jgi:hypothetical protein